MHGDGDSYTDKEYWFSGDHTESFKLEDLVCVIDLFKKHECSENIDKLKKYGISEMNIDHFRKYLIGDITTDHSLFAYIESYNIVYFDRNGIEYSVSEQ